MRPCIVTFVLVATCVSSLLGVGQACGQPGAALAPKPTAGVLLNDPRACPGYTLVAPMTTSDTYLIDLAGHVVHTWHSDWQPALSAYLLPNGNLLRPAALLPGEKPFGGPGAGGRIQEFSWDGELLWDYKFPVDRRLPHHDVAPLPNGNVLVVAWDKRTADEGLAAGRRPELVANSPVLSDSILEIKPTGKTTGEILWEWHVWDHLIQDHDESKANYGDVAAHPELVDVNLSEKQFGALVIQPDEDDGLLAKGLGFGPRRGFGQPAGVPDLTSDWTHANFVAYNAELDQIILSVRSFSEIWIIDHSTTTAEAAGHKGGRYGKGGDLLYRWGNPRAHRAGTSVDQRLFKQHHADWIPADHPGAGNVLLFNNGNNRPGGAYSTVDEIVLPVDSAGRYRLPPGRAWEPREANWSYAAPTKSDLFSMVVGGVQRLPNGNTLICAGASGTLLEVTPQKELVWKFVNPIAGSFAGYSADRPRRIGRGGLPTVNNAVFRAPRYAPDSPGLRGKDLQPGKLLVEMQLEAQAEPQERQK